MKAEQKYTGNKRTFTGLLIQPHKQLGFIFLYLLGGVYVIAAFVFYMLNLLQANFMTLVPSLTGNEETIRIIGEEFEMARILLVFMTVIITVLALYAGLNLSHRVFGPFVPFIRHVRELMAGNYKSRVRLRKRDQFHDFKELLNELAEALEKKK